MRAVIRAEEFKRLINNTKRFTRDSSNKLMQYIYLEVNAETKEIRATAVDGYRVSIEYAGVMEVDESFSCYCKKDIPKIKKSDLNVELELADNKLFITVGEYITGYKQPEGEYFKVDKLREDTKAVPVEASIYVDAKLLKEALESIDQSPFNRTVKIEIRDKKSPILITPAREKKNEKYVLPVRWTKED